MIVKGIIQKDSVQFKNHNAAYVNDPVGTSELALERLFQDMKWRDHWDQFLSQMVYDTQKPTFSQAYEQLQLLTVDILEGSALT